MNDKRRINLSVWPHILLVVGVATLIAALALYFNFPTNPKPAYYSLGLTLVLVVSAVVLRPSVFKELFGNRRALLWLNNILMVLFIVGIGVVLSYIGFRRNFRYDFTYNQLFSLSEQTIKVIRELDKETKITAFYPKGIAEGVAIEDLLREYSRNNANLTYVMVDPVRDPLTSRAMNIKQVGQIVVQAGSNRVDIPVSELFYQPNPYAHNPNDKPKFTGEQAITSAIVNVTSGIKRTVGFVTGHGEGSSAGYHGRDFGQLAEYLSSENLEVAEISLGEPVSKDINALIIGNPQQDYLESELVNLKEFLSREGKSLIMALDYGFDLPNLEEFALAEYGVMYSSDLAVDVRGLQTGQPGVLIPILEEHAISSPIRNRNMSNIMYLARTLTLEEKTGMQHSLLLSSVPESWGKRIALTDGQIKANELKEFKEGQDIRGPLSLGVAVDVNPAVASSSKALFFADSDFFSNSLIRQLANRDLIVNSVNWAVGQMEMVSVRPRVLEIPQIDFKPESANLVFTFCVFGAPMMVVLFGAIIYIYRRRV